MSQHPVRINVLLTDQFEDRPPGTQIDTLIIHSMHNPDSDDKFSASSCKKCLDQFGVSSHYLIDIDGLIWRMVPEDKKAWHAGVSKMPDPTDAREGVNAFSIGIELVGTETSGYTAEQYESLIQLSKDILSRHKIRNIYGHSDVAPERKTDPWCFDWNLYKKRLEKLCELSNTKFPEAGS